MTGTVQTFEPQRHFQWHAWPDLHNLPKREPLVKRLLDRTAMSVVYGESNCGKTFVALDLASHISLGWEWCGRRVRQGRVAYIAAEGGLGLEERLTAFRFHYGIEGSADLLVLPTSVDLCRPDASTEPLIEDMRQLGPFELVIVDTLSRAMAGGNENSPDDMGAFVGNCDRIRQETGAHVCIVHHAGKDTSKGARGHSALRAATDTEIEVTKDEVAKIVSATVAKQRDHPGGDVFTFRMELVDIGMDDDEERKTSCVLVPCDEAATTSKKRPSGKAGLALDTLREIIAEGGELSSGVGHMPTGVRVVRLNLWREYLLKRGLLNADGNPRQQFARIRERLLSSRHIGIWDEWVWEG